MSVKDLKRKRGMVADAISKDTGEIAWSAYASRYGVQVFVYDTEFPVFLPWDRLRDMQDSTEAYFAELDARRGESDRDQAQGALS